MKKILSFLAIVLMGIVGFAQTVTLTFTGRDAADHHVQLNHVTITNLTKGWQETLMWPDTILTMQNGTGIAETVANGDFGLSQNNPNPFSGTTDVNLTVVDAGAVMMEIVDMNGRRVVVETFHETSLQLGTNQFHVSLSATGTYVMTAHQNGKSSSIKMMCNGTGNGNGIKYIGPSAIETVHAPSLQPKSHNRGTSTNPFDFGDQMEYVGGATINGDSVESRPVTQAQDSSQTIVLMFDETQGNVDGQPCPGTPTVTDIDGNIYNTVQIGNQCWMKENLRTTHYADNTVITFGETYSDIMPYCYLPNNDESNVAAYGYLYNWAAVMHGATSSEANPSGVQGVCPDGWHVPSDVEWTQLSDYVSSRSEYVCGDTDSQIAKALASTNGWHSSEYSCTVGFGQSTNNATGFSALPAGYYFGDYDNFGSGADFWSGTANDESTAYYRHLGFSNADVFRYSGVIYYGFSVRCLRN